MAAGKASLWDMMGIDQRKTSVFWIFYSFPDEDAGHRRYDDFLEALDDHTDYAGQVDVSFYVAKSVLPIRELASALAEVCDIKADTLLVARLDGTEVVYLGDLQFPDQLTHLLPYAERLA